MFFYSLLQHDTNNKFVSFSFKKMATPCRNVIHTRWNVAYSGWGEELGIAARGFPRIPADDRTRCPCISKKKEPHFFVRTSQRDRMVCLAFFVGAPNKAGQATLTHNFRLILCWTSFFTVGTKKNSCTIPGFGGSKCRNFSRNAQPRREEGTDWTLQEHGNLPY